MKIAHFSPLPPQRSGVADYCAALLPYLRAEMNVTAYDNNTLHRFGLRERLAVDACVYHMGNHPAYHSEIWRLLQRFPGAVVLHDAALGAFHQQRGAAHLVREMGYEAGPDGAVAARHFVHAGRLPATPLVQRIADVSRALIVHTSYAKNLLAPHTQTPIHHIPLGTTIPPAPLSNQPNDQLILGVFGFLAPSKRVEPLLRAIARIRDAAPSFRLYLVGEVLPALPLDALLDAYDLNDRVIVENFLPPDQFEKRLAQVDIGINLRTGPTGGEMSASLVRLLAHGKPVLVSAVGGFLGVPEDVVLHVAQDETEVDAIGQALLGLMRDEARRAAYGRSARRYAETSLAFPLIAKRYKAVLTRLIQPMPLT